MSAYDYGRWGEWHQRVLVTMQLIATDECL
jgi:hypothetical protein